MPLSKAQIIEIQETAKYNFHKRVKEQEEKKKLQETVEKKIAERTAVNPVASTSEKKGK